MVVAVAAVAGGSWWWWRCRLRVVVVAAAESEWDVGGRNVGARRSVLYASAKGDVTA